MSTDFAKLEPKERLATVSLKPCQPLTHAQAAIDYAIRRFHESWQAYKTITPSLYLIGPFKPGRFVTLGQLRRSYGLTAKTLEALTEALEDNYPVTGYLVAGEAIGGEPPRALFGLKGHEDGQVLYGALDLALLSPFEASFDLESDVKPEDWFRRKQEAWASSPFPLR